MFLRLYVKVVFTIIAVSGGKLSVPVQKINDDLLQIFAQFAQYNVILHLDNSTKDVFDELIWRINEMVFIMNYDTVSIQSRPSGYKFLNIIYLRNVLEFQRFSEDYTNIQQSDVLFFLNSDISLNSNHSVMWQLPNLQQSLGLFVYNLPTSRLHFNCFYCGLNTTYLQEVFSRNFSRISNYFISYSNFHEHDFRVGYMSFLPFFWCKVPSVDCTGPEANLLQLLSKKLNFQYTLVNFENSPGDKGKWRTLVDAVHNKSLDWGVGGVSLSPERSYLTDLTRVIHSEAYTILYHCQVSETWNSWRQILKPFSFSLWACILLAFVGIVILLKYLPDSVNSNTVKHIEIMVRGLFEQPLRFLPIQSMAKRLVFITWLYTCIILITAYKSKVVSMMIHSHYDEFESIQELLQHGYAFQVSHLDWSVLKENWEASAKSDKAFQEILKKTSNDLPTCAIVEKMMNKKVAYIDETSTMLYQVKMCQSFINQEPSSRLCLIDKEVCPSFHIWPMQLGAAYRYRFSYIIENLHSAGILGFWYNSVLEKLLLKTKNIQQTTSTSGLTLATMASSIFVLGFGLAISFVIFLMELTYHHSERIMTFLKKFTF